MNPQLRRQAKDDRLQQEIQLLRRRSASRMPAWSNSRLIDDPIIHQ
jgi:hypothetical protein